MSAPEIGYHLSSEEHSAGDLVKNAGRAEEAGFTFAPISDHYHPWVSRQGHSPFVWPVLGGIARTTERMRVGTGVTAPIIRMHPAIIAQAAATVATMMPGRFFLGLGTGENLNEHVVGEEWPSHPERLEMLSEAIDIMRGLWEGDTFSHRGRHYTVEGARLFDLPVQAPPILLAATGQTTAGVAGQKADGLISVLSDPELVRRFEEAGGEGKPRYLQVTVCFDEDESQARKIVAEMWPISAVPGSLMSELRLPADFEAVSELITEDQATRRILCSSDPERHIAKIEEAAAAGFDHVWVHQIGPKQEEFIDFYAREVLPKIG